ncbi:50S ribosomal protein L25, partial [Novacetimonas hansenii]|nr:50S ribosomal protein L25 [Novacetimonas hansenii]
MTKFTKIEVSSRAKAGKGAARATRRAGHVPSVIYGGGQEPTLIALDPRIVQRELHKSGWRSRIYDISVE